MGPLGKSFSSKFKTIKTLAVSRIAILKNQHKARCSYAKSDVAQLLNLGYHDRALLRVEQLIKEQNMLDVFVMIENCCNFLGERSQVLEKNKECPHELKEVISSLIYASSRCGEFPELHKIREIFTSKFGKEFADDAIELHKNNRVNSKMIQKLSPKRPAMEIKMKALKKIAAEIGVTLHFEQDPTLINVNKLNDGQRLNELETEKCSSTDDTKHKENNQDGPENINLERKRYMDAVSAVQEALELASFGIEVSDENSNHTTPLKYILLRPDYLRSDAPRYFKTCAVFIDKLKVYSRLPHNCILCFSIGDLNI
ncbi:hypothetical protein RIF29_13946 [Crotalaria pallida]|uniref:Uncharacterized protein n=1 Tax=Crotalaria pallida TaxID=3830 RepID=A0AAN9ICA9_CROPI